VLLAQLQRRTVEACGILIDTPAAARAAISGGLFPLLLQRALLHVKLPGLVSHQGLLERAALLAGKVTGYRHLWNPVFFSPKRGVHSISFTGLGRGRGFAALDPPACGVLLQSACSNGARVFDAGAWAAPPPSPLP
jgi:hypothetical protein